MKQEKEILHRYAVWFGHLPLFYTVSTLIFLMMLCGVQVVCDEIGHPHAWEKWVAYVFLTLGFGYGLYHYQKLKRDQYPLYQQAYEKWTWYQYYKQFRHGSTRAKEEHVLTLLSYSYAYDSYQEREMMYVKAVTKFGQYRTFYTENVEQIEQLTPRQWFTASLRGSVCYALEVSL